MREHPIVTDHPLISLIYDGAVDVRRWNELVESCLQILNGSSGSMFFSWNIGNDEEYFHLIDDIHALGPSMNVGYAETFRILDPYQYDEMVSGEVYQIDQFILRSSFLNSQYYLDF